MRMTLVLCGLVATSTASAQQPLVATSPSGPLLAPPSMSPLVSNLQLVAPWLRGEPTGPAGLSSWVLSTPLRLSLQGGIHPVAGGFPNCASREEPSGNTVNGFAVQRFASIRLGGALTLQGFSSAGCPVDGAFGAGLTYTVPVDASLWLVASTGIYAVPAHAPLPARQSADARVDLMKQLQSGSTVSVGVGGSGIRFGGTW